MPPEPPRNAASVTESFAEMLQRHVACGTHPGCDLKKTYRGRWSQLKLAASLINPATGHNYSKDTISLWMRGLALPTDVTPLLDVFFGSDPNLTSFRRAMYAAWEAEKEAAELRSRGGARATSSRSSAHEATEHTVTWNGAVQAARKIISDLGSFSPDVIAAFNGGGVLFASMIATELAAQRGGDNIYDQILLGGAVPPLCAMNQILKGTVAPGFGCSLTELVSRIPDRPKFYRASDFFDDAYELWITPDLLRKSWCAEGRKADSNKALVVSDISYTGRTLTTVKEILGLPEFGWDVQTAALVSCSAAKVFNAEPDKVGNKLITSPPVVFPWGKFEIT